jgi:hypothetical protein
MQENSTSTWELGDGKISGFPPFFHSFVKSGLAEFLVYRPPSKCLDNVQWQQCGLPDYHVESHSRMDKNT